MKNFSYFFIFGFVLLILQSCQNRDINEGEAFKPREIHEDIVFHFDMIEVDGVEYLILEKDNNNPHEGFGFMALRGNKLIEKSDTALAYLRTLTELQTRMYAAMTRRTYEDTRTEVDELLKGYLDEESELIKLEQRKFRNESIILPEIED